MATLGTLPEVKWPKNYFLAVFLGKHSGKMVAIGSGHFGDPPRGQMAKNLFFGSFSRETFWQSGGRRKWPLWGPSPRSNGQKFLFFGSFSRETFWQNCGRRKWPLGGLSLRTNGMQYWKSQKKKRSERNPGEARRYRRFQAVLAKPGEVEIVQNSGEARRRRELNAILAKPEEKED